MAEEIPLDALDILQDSLALFISRYDEKVSKWYDTILDQELLVVVLGSCNHFYLYLFLLLLELLFLPLLLKLSLFPCISLLLLFLLILFLLLRLLLLLHLQLDLPLLFVQLLQHLPLFLPLLGALLHHYHLTRLFWNLDKRASLFLAFLAL